MVASPRRLPTGGWYPDNKRETPTRATSLYRITQWVGGVAR